MGIDLSKAFDCINRRALLDLLHEHVDVSTYCIIQYLLADTTIQIKMQVDPDIELGHMELVEDVVENPVHSLVSDAEHVEASGNGYSSLATVSDRKDDGFGSV